MQTRSRSKQSRGVQKPGAVSSVVTMRAAELGALVARGELVEYKGGYLATKPGTAEEVARELCFLKAAVDAEKAKVREVLEVFILAVKRELSDEDRVELGWQAFGDMHAFRLGAEGAEALVDFGPWVAEWAAGAYDVEALVARMEMPVLRAIGAASLRALLPCAVVEVTRDGVAVTRAAGGPRAELTYAPRRMVWGAELLDALERWEAQRQA